MNPQADFSGYNKILLWHVAFFLKEDAEYRGFRVNEMKKLADAFHKVIIEALSDTYSFVDNLGSGVMQIRLALTQVEPINAVIYRVTAVVPVGVAINLIKIGITGRSLDVGTTSMEAEILDSQTRARLAAAILNFISHSIVVYFIRIVQR